MIKNQIGILKFNPVYFYRIWGGSKLKSVLNKPIHENLIGESWEISGVKDHHTSVSEGLHQGKNIYELIKEFKGDLLGDAHYLKYGTEFPILVKFIDSDKPLSIQVHPDNKLAKERHNENGKNEMWYIMEAEENAELTIGFKKQLSKEDYLKHLDKETLEEAVNTLKVKEKDVFHIPTGRVHAIGKGILLAEIQQTSDITYRIYDYNRVDPKTNQKRELHTELALEAIDFSVPDQYITNYDKTENKSNDLIHSPFFKTDYLNITSPFELDFIKNESFRILLCTSGSCVLKTSHDSNTLKKGETCLIPANETKLSILPDSSCEILFTSL